MIFNLTQPVLDSAPKFTYTGTYEYIDDGSGNWRLKFLTSGTLTLKNKITVDVFLVGGGGSGGKTNSVQYGVGGGGGGYTNTVKKVVLNPGQYTITVGAGGASTTSGSPYYQNGNAGGASSAFGATANGGQGGQCGGYGQAGEGGAGGSGGGRGSHGNGAIGAGGSDGADGGNSGGAGQGTTTREFGEASGELYSGGGGTFRDSDYASSAGGAGGGGAGGRPGVAGTANTGGGGGGAGDDSISGAGGSGIVIIRKHKEAAA